MNTPARSYSARSTFVMLGLAVVTVAYFAFPAYAAAPDPTIPNISIIDVKKGDDKLAKPAPAGNTAKGGNTSGNAGKPGSNNAGRPGGNNNGGGNMSGARTLSATKGEITYIITLRNGGKIPAKGLTVEYTFYNLTTNTTNGLSDYTVEPITGTESVDIDPSQVKNIETQPISHANTQNLSSGGGNNNNNSGFGGGGGRGRTLSTPISSSTVTKVLGWHVEVRYNDKVLQKRDQPDNIDALVKKYNK